MFIFDRILYFLIVSSFIRLNMKPFPRVIANFLFNSYKPMLSSEIVELTVSLLVIFVK